jgi:NAD(P) transhydrogenase
MQLQLMLSCLYLCYFQAAIAFSLNQHSLFKPYNQNTRRKTIFRYKDTENIVNHPGDDPPISYNKITIGVSKEGENESRVSLSPEAASLLIKEGFSVLIESEAGTKSLFNDDMYQKVGAKVSTREDVWKHADIVTKITPPSIAESKLLGNKTLISLIYPSQHPDLMASFLANNSTVFALDCIPRLLSRGQTYDVLSTQANIAGYRAVIETAEAYGSMLGGQLTAAG